MSRIRFGVYVIVGVAISLMAQGRSGGGGSGENKSGRAKYRVIVGPDSVQMRIGERCSFQAYLIDSQGSRKDTTFSWSLAGAEIGTLTQEGVFTALERGRTHIVATAGRLSGKARVIVQGDSTRKNEQKRGLQIRIDPQTVVLAIGDTLRFRAVCMAPGRRVVDTTIVWSYEGENAVLSSEGFLEALSVGKGWVYATVGDFSDRAVVVVREKPKPAVSVRQGFFHLKIEPSDTVIGIGETVQFSAYLIDTAGVRRDTVVTWVLRPSGVGTISQEGLFTAESRGAGLIQARVGTRLAVARVMVRDGTPCDTARIRIRDREGYQYGRLHRISESDVLEISGLPFPFSLLNGGELILPPGSLDQGIAIEISLPDLADIRNDTTVVFPEGILNGISFDVYVDSVKVSPYVFATPVLVVLPYKEDLMEKLGITPDDLALMFYHEDGTFGEEGTVTFLIDTVHHKVYAEVSHFSQLVVGDRSRLIPATIAPGSILRPVRFILDPNYPNPFNSSTLIRFQIEGTGIYPVKLSIFDLFGRKVRILADSRFPTGVYIVPWDGRDDMGAVVASGVYFYRFESETTCITQRMVLVK